MELLTRCCRLISRPATVDCLQWVQYCLQWIVYSGYSIVYSGLSTVGTVLPSLQWVQYCLQWIVYSGYSIVYSGLSTVGTVLPMVVSDSQVIVGYIRMCILWFVQVLYYFNSVIYM